MIELIIAAGLISFLLMYFASQLNTSDHFILRLFLFCMAVLFLILVSKGAIDSQEKCEIVNHDHTFTYFQGSETFSGLTLGAHHPNQVMINEALSFFITVYSETGKPQTNATTTCSCAITDSQGEITNLTNTTNYNGYNDVWQCSFPTNLLNHTGLWTYQLFCRDTNNGGYFNGEIDVTEDGLVHSELICEQMDTKTATTLYKLVSYIFLIFMSYVMYYFVYWAFSRVAEYIKKGKRKGRNR